MTMKDVTREFLIYRESVRHIWNAFYMPVIEKYKGSFELERTFCKIETELFVALVAIPLNDDISELVEHMKDPKVGLDLYHVVPNSNYEVPVMISRDKNNTQYWDHPIEKLKRDDADMKFIRFFDFASDNYIDLKYIMAEIVESKTYPDIKGRLILLEMQYASIFQAEQLAP